MAILHGLFVVGKRAKIHHFIPRALQKHFSLSNNQIWYSEKSIDQIFSTPQLRNISSTFKARDHYTVLENGKLTDRFERTFYGALDNYLAGFLDQVHHLLDNEKVPIISGYDLGGIQETVYHLIARNPAFTKGHDEFSIGKEIVEGTINDAVRKGLAIEYIKELESELSEPSKLRNLGRTVRVKSQVSPSKEALDALGEFQVRISVSLTKHSYILPGMGAYRIGNGGPNGLSNPDMEIWVPISPKRALVLLRDPSNRIPPIVADNRDQIRAKNEYGVANSNQIASHSRQLLNSLIYN